MVGTINFKPEKDSLIVVIEYTSDPKLSKSGKTKILASTQGFYRIPGTEDSINFNVVRRSK